MYGDKGCPSYYDRFLNSIDDLLQTYIHYDHSYCCIFGFGLVSAKEIPPRQAWTIAAGCAFRVRMFLHIINDYIAFNF